MSVLYLVRHGQTDFSEGIYHKLTTKGRIQCEGLARDWLDREIRPEHIFIGPRRRHLESAEAVAATARERSTTWPEATEIEHFDEYAAEAVIRHALMEDTGLDEAFKTAAHGFMQGNSLSNPDFERMFQMATRAWVRGELTPPDAEAFPDFRARVERGLRQIMKIVGPNSSAAVFTSAGPVAAAIGMALDLADERALELSWMVRNSATTELLFSGERVSLNTFNGVEHLSDPVLVTAR